MVVQQGPASIKQKEIKTEFPVAEGLITGTTTQTGRVMNLVPEQSLVPQRERCGLSGR